MPENKVVYKGAIVAMMDGEHPDLIDLIPYLPQHGGDAGAAGGDAGADADADAGAGADAGAAADAAADAGAGAGAGDAGTGADAGDAGDAGADAADAGDAAGAGADLSSANKTHGNNVISPTIFRAYDIRGVVGDTLSATGMYKIGQSIGSEAQEIGQQRIVVGQDNRLSSTELNAALIAGLRSSGCDVIYIGTVPTPLLYFATHHLKTGNSTMITGSHSSAEYNGVKIMLAGQALSGELLKALYQRINNGNFVSGQGAFRSANINADYLHAVEQDMQGNSTDKKFKIVVDCGNGVTGQLAPALYRKLGHEVVNLFCELDGSFPNHHPDPSQPENLQALIETVKKEGADLGFAFDGDGDRLGVVDGQGNVIWPDRQMMLFAEDVLATHKGANIVFDVKCSRHLQTVIEENNGKPLMWKTGHSFIKAKMQAVDAPLAGEFSGHIFFSDRWYGFDDALYAGARMLEILSHRECDPSDAFADLPNSVATHELRIPLDEAEHAQIMQMIKEKAVFPDAKITDLDGIRVDFPYGFGLIRASNTGPFLVARFEADDADELDKIKADFRHLVGAAMTDVKLPF